jgi:hypothetical protein
MAHVEELIAYAERLGLESSDLDGAVHDGAQDEGLDTLNGLEDEQEQEEHIARLEENAAAINNGGLSAQLDYLLRHNSIKEVRQLLEEVARRESQPG